MEIKEKDTKELSWGKVKLAINTEIEDDKIKATIENKEFVIWRISNGYNHFSVENVEDLRLIHEYLI